MRKTKILALLLAVAMIASMIVPSVSAAAACPAHADAEWTEITEGEWTGGELAEGHYKLTGNQTITSALTVAGNVCIDLAGYSITADAAKDNAYRVFEVTGVLTITDSAETDGVISGGHMEGTSDTAVHIYGGNILVSGAAAKLNLYGGVISDGYMKAGDAYYHIYGGNIGLTDGAEMNIYGGTVKDGKIEAPQQSAYYQGGGNIYALDSTVNVYGGTVSGGDVIARYESGNKNPRKVYGAGGNIAVNGGTFYMEDGLVDDGNLDVLCNSTNKSDNPAAEARARGGNVYCLNAVVTIKGGVISNGTLSSELKVSGTGSQTIEAQGGNLYINNCTAEIKGNAQILDGEVVNDITAARGGNLFVAAGTVTMSENAVISGGTCPTDNARGGNVFVIGTFNINGGTIFGGAAGWGANMMLQSGATINLNAGTISGGTGDASVLIQRGTFNMNGGSIENPEGKFAALSVEGTTNANGGKAYINGGVVGDISTNRASEVHVTAGTIGKMEKAHTSTIEVADGVTVKYNPALNEVEGFDAYVMDKSTGTTYYALYANLADALAAAESGNTVSLMRDVTAEDIYVPAGVTLNLYGSNLTANAVTATAEGAQIKDSKLSASGVGKIISDSVAVSADNTFLPLKNANEWQFQEVTFKQNLDAEAGLYKFYIAEATAETLIDDAILAGEAVSIDIVVTWTNGLGQPKAKTFTLDSTLLAQYAGNWDTKMITLTFVDLTNVTDLTCTAQVSANGVAVKAA